MPHRTGEWQRKLTGVAWADVWRWAQDLYGERGLVVAVSLHPPTGSKKDPHGRLVVTVSRMQPGVGYVPTATKWADLPDPLKVSAEATALRLLIDIINGMGTAEEEAQRAARELANSLW